MTPLSLPGNAESIARRPSLATYIFLALFPGISLWVHFRSVAVMGWDAEPPMRPDLLPFQALHVWHANVFFGQANPFDSAFFVPIGFIYWALNLIGIGPALAEKILICTLFVLPAYGAYWFARELRAPRSVAYLCGILYALSPVLLIRLYVPIVHVQLAYAMTPAIAAGWIRVLRSDQRELPRAFALFAALELLVTSAAANPEFWIAPQLLCLLISVGYLMRHGNWGVVLKSALGVAMLLCLNAFWILQIIRVAEADAASLMAQSVNHAYTKGVTHDIAISETPLYSLRLLSKAISTSGDQYGLYWTYGNVLAIPIVSALYFVYVIFAGLGLVARRLEPSTIFMGVVFWGTLFLMKGAAPPLGFIGQTLSTAGLRDPFDKLAPLAALALAFLAARGAMSIAGRMMRDRMVTVIGIACLLMFPLWTGQAFEWRPAGPSLAALPSKAALAFFRSLDSYKGRILLLPTSDNALLINTTWGFYGPNVFGSWTRASMIPMMVSTLNREETNQFSTSLYSSVTARNVRLFLRDAQNGGIGAVLISGDVSDSYYGGMSPKSALRFVRSVPGVRRLRTEGPYELWQLPGSTGTPGALAVRPMLTPGSSSDVMRIATSCEEGCQVQRLPVLAHRRRKPYVLVHDSQFDPLWRATVRTPQGRDMALPHIEIDGFRNGWLLSGEEQGPITVSYGADETATLGRQITGWSFALIALMIAGAELFASQRRRHA
jgi:hypothetical protein